ncbi:hypothetical protein HYC85_027910 [Camellia sinensis]|uniref:Uncharacterized protein n=1 Tax=Camellia sinensis TaxID=4442 RepID=A0A7J7FTY1_CAMSI|nr:hypothetical protein HYC85_027910 [Camellia sinensis]
MLHLRRKLCEDGYPNRCHPMADLHASRQPRLHRRILRSRHLGNQPFYRHWPKPGIHRHRKPILCSSSSKTMPGKAGQSNRPYSSRPVYRA